TGRSPASPWPASACRAGRPVSPGRPVSHWSPPALNVLRHAAAKPAPRSPIPMPTGQRTGVAFGPGSIRARIRASVVVVYELGTRGWGLGAGGVLGSSSWVLRILDLFGFCLLSLTSSSPFHRD